MVLLKYAIQVVSEEGYSWLGYFPEDCGVQYYEDFRDAYLFSHLQVASMICDALNSITDTRVYKVCSVNVIINDEQEGK